MLRDVPPRQVRGTPPRPVLSEARRSPNELAERESGSTRMQQQIQGREAEARQLRTSSEVQPDIPHVEWLPFRGGPLLVVFFDKQSGVFSKAADVAHAFSLLYGSEEELYADSGMQVEHPADHDLALVLHSRRADSRQHWQVRKNSDGVLAAGFGSNKKDRMRAAYLALSLALAVADTSGPPDFSSWCPVFSALYARARQLRVSM